MKKIKDLNDNDKYDIVGPVIRHLKENWNIQASPKGYSDFTEDYIDFKGFDDLDYAKLYDSFLGYKDGDRPFPLKVCLPSIAYDDICQGNEPFEVLVWAIWSYGKAYGKYEALNDGSLKSNKKHAIQLIEFAKKIVEEI